MEAERAWLQYYNSLSPLDREMQNEICNAAAVQIGRMAEAARRQRLVHLETAEYASELEGKIREAKAEHDAAVQAYLKRKREQEMDSRLTWTYHH